MKPEIYKGMPAVFKRKDGKFEIKILVTGGMLSPGQVRRIGEVAEKYGGEVHITVRQELSILGVPEERLDLALQDLAEAGLAPGSAGMTFRNVVSCLGSDYCFKAAAETTSLAKEVAEAFTGEKTPGPLKVGIGGCPFPCTRPQFNEIGIMGRVRPEMDAEKCTGCERCVAVCKVGAASVVDGKAVIDYDKCIMCGRCVVNCPGGARYSAEDGYMLFVGGRGSWPPLEGWILRDFVGREEILPLIGRILEVYGAGAKPGMRLREFIKTIGFEEFRRRVASADSDQG